jgi:hypothetical protein
MDVRADPGEAPTCAGAESFRQRRCAGCTRRSDRQMESGGRPSDADRALSPHLEPLHRVPDDGRVRRHGGGHLAGDTSFGQGSVPDSRMARVTAGIAAGDKGPALPPQGRGNDGPGGVLPPLRGSARVEGLQRNSRSRRPGTQAPSSRLEKDGGRAPMRRSSERRGIRQKVGRSSQHPRCDRDNLLSRLRQASWFDYGGWRNSSTTSRPKLTTGASRATEARDLNRAEADAQPQGGQPARSAWGARGVEKAGDSGPSSRAADTRLPTRRKSSAGRSADTKKDVQLRRRGRQGGGSVRSWPARAIRSARRRASS